jgi:hypothetical protein
MVIMMIESSSLGAIGAFGSFEFDLLLALSHPPCIVKRCSLAAMCMNVCILSIARFVFSLASYQVANNVLLIFVIMYPKYGFAHKLA